MRNDLKVNPADYPVNEKLKKDVIEGLKSRFVFSCKPNFHLTVPANSSFLDPRYKSLSYLSDEGVKENIKFYILDLIKVKNQNAVLLSHFQRRRRGRLFSYLDEDFAQEESDGPEDELFKYQAEPVLIRNPLNWWKHLWPGSFRVICGWSLGHLESPVTPVTRLILMWNIQICILP